MLRRQMAEERKAATEFPQMQSVIRIARIPFVDSGIGVVTGLYTRIKTSNPLFNWGLEQAEHSVSAVLDHTKPAVAIFHTPLELLDSLLCKSLDLVEEKVPVVTLPPELIYVSTKDYVSNTLVRPVLQRAGSVKQFGLQQANTVLASKYSNYAAHRLDSALDLADKYVDQYLPADASDPPQAPDETDAGQTGSQAAHAIHHVDIFSRKLQRRLTRRTIAEAKALKRQSVDAVQFMMNMAELLAKDPRAALEKASILWAHLSEAEPENQARPENLEQLTVMVSREAARRVVHVVNYARQNAGAWPRHARGVVRKAVTAFASLADTVVKKTHLEGLRNLVSTQMTSQLSKLQLLLSSLNAGTVRFLEAVAARIAGNSRQLRQRSNGSAVNNRAAVVNNLLHNSFE